MKSRAPLILAGLLAAASDAAAQGAQEQSDQRPWTVTATALAYVVPEQPDFVMVLVPADFRRLHVEGRYNYEALHSGSAFVGVNASWGEKLKLGVTPMIGGVFGDLTGLVPALRWTLRWWKLDVFSESEIVVDPTHTADTFFYDWSEVGFSPLSWLRLGAAVQRSLVFKTPLDIQRGLFVGVTVRFVTVTVYEFNAGWTTPTWVGAASVSL